jgi:hypothetical protein
MPRKAAKGLMNMAKGGHARSGPPPDPNALRRERDAGEWVVLPAEGCADDPPQWPLVGHSDREAQLWKDLWAKPQAFMWHRNGCTLEVALLVRNLTMAEIPGSPVNLGTLVRQQSDSLGLTTPGLRCNRWRIAPDELAAKRAGRTAPPAVATRDRLRAVRNAAEAG